MDLNGDGILDVMSGRYMPGDVTFFKGTKDGFAAGEKIEEQANEKKAADVNGKRPRVDVSRMMATTNFIDWDQDGDIDMVLGNVKGAVFLNINAGTKTNFKFGRRQPLQTDAGPIKVVQKSDPLPIDWDGDGKVDLLVGDEAADVTFFRGRGDGKFDAGVSLWTGEKAPPGERYAAAKKRLEDKAKVPGYRLRLATCDWNNDGKLDLLVGNCFTEQTPEGSKQRGKTLGNVYLFLRR